MLSVPFMPSVAVGHEQVTGKHGHDKNQQADVAAQAQCRGKEYEQQRQNAADEHPYQVFIFHVRRYFFGNKQAFQSRSIESSWLNTLS